VLTMNDVPCSARLEGKNGGKVAFYVCNHLEAGQYKRRVTSAICEACPLRLGTDEPTFKAEIMADGRIVYERRPGDWEPPREHKGYRRDPDNAWVFIPVWPACVNRELNEKRLSTCGCLIVEMTCRDERSPCCGQRVELAACQACPLVRSE
jgi:hypothetical protein